VSFDQIHLVKPVINQNIIVNVIDSNNILMDDIVKYNKEWKTIIDDYRRKIKFNLPKTRERFKKYINTRLSLLPPTTENPVTGKFHRLHKKSTQKKSASKNSTQKKSADKKSVDKKSPDKKSADKKSADKKSPDKKSPDKKSPVPPIDIVAANLDQKILSYLG